MVNQTLYIAYEVVNSSQQQMILERSINGDIIGK